MTDPNQPPAYRPPSNPPPSDPPPSYPQPTYPSPSSPTSRYEQPTYPPAQPSYPQTSSSPSTYPPPAYPPASYGAGPTGQVPGRTLGIVALIGSVVVAGLSLLWLVLGIVALVKSRRAGHRNGFAIAAIIISVLAFIASIVLVGYAIYFGVTIGQLCAQYGPGTYEINGVDVDLSCS